MFASSLERWLRIPKWSWLLWGLASALWLTVPWRMAVWLPIAAERNPKDFDYPLMGPALGTALLIALGFPFLLLLLWKCTRPYAGGASLLAWDRRYAKASLAVTLFFAALIAWQILWAVDHVKLGLWWFLASDALWIYLWASLRAGLVAQAYPKFAG